MRIDDAESNPADVAEQQRPVEPADEAGEAPRDPAGMPLEANPADVLEQEREVPFEDADELY